MAVLSRRGLLKGGVGVAAGVAVAGGPFQGFLALAEGAARRGPSPNALGPVADLRDGVVRLWLPAGFEYRSFHDTEAPVLLDDGTRLPGRHDGMGAFAGPNGNVLLVRNHEINGPGAAFGPGTPYDAQARGGTTTIEVTLRGEVVNAFTSLNGTQMNCAGGVMPWGSWITCEETVNGPDVGPDFTRPIVSNVPLQKRHGFIFEVPAGGQSDRVPITQAGRFAHEAAAFDPRTGYLYETEDNFGFPSGFYRYLPPNHPLEVGRVEDGGDLQMLAVVGQFNADLARSQAANIIYRVAWVDIADPAPTFPYTPGQEAPTINNDALQYVSKQGLALGAARFSRLEGAHYDELTGNVYFTSTQGGGAAEPTNSDTVGGWGNGSGQVWAYDTYRNILRLVYQSPGPQTLDLPDNVTVRPGRTTLVLCEDNVNDNYLRGLSRGGRLSDIALNRLVSSLPPRPTRYNDEFAGATFSPNGETLYVNIQASAGMTFAIWGPWDRIRV